MPQAEIKEPTMPVDVTLQEAEDLFVWANEDKKDLVSKGLDWKTFVEDLPIRTGALRHAQAVWMAERYSQEEAIKEWKSEAPIAYEFRDDLMADFRFAFRKRPKLLSRVRAVGDGTGDADMIQDLSDLSALGKANKEELKKVNFDLSLLDEAEKRSGELADLQAKANGSRMDNSQAKETRDRAFTHLKEAVDEIRATGKYAFRKNPERFKGYVSRHKRR